MNADVREIVAEFTCSDEHAGGSLRSLRAASRDWHAAVLAAIRYHGAVRHGPITTIRAILCPDLVIAVSPETVRCVCRAAMMCSPPGWLDLRTFAGLGLMDSPHSMLPPLWRFVHAERIERLVFPTSVVALPDECFDQCQTRSVVAARHHINWGIVLRTS